jgi:flagellin-like hook-associated protein FlgL
MNNFDFNISQYSVKELIDMFKLQPNFKEIDVYNQQQALLDKVLKDPQNSTIVKEKLKSFLTEASKIINATSTSTTLTYDVIEAPKTPYVPSFPSQYFAGNINPLKRRTIEKQLNIDTQLLPAITSASDFRLPLPSFINNVMTMKLVTFEYPYDAAFNISADYKNNYFNIIVNPQGTDSSNITITIQDGKYSITTLMDYLNNTSFVNISLLNGFNVQNINNRFQISSPPPDDPPIIFSLIIPEPFGMLTGFLSNQYNQKATYISENPIDLNYLKYCFLCINDYNNNVNNSITNVNKSMNNILSRITFQQGYPAILNHSPREYFGPVNINTIQVQLLDRFGNPLSSTLNYSFCLTFEIVYDL